LSGGLVKREMDSAIDAASLFFARHRRNQSRNKLRRTEIQTKGKVKRKLYFAFYSFVIPQFLSAAELTATQSQSR
jgi:hypothetical protein